MLATTPGKFLMKISGLFMRNLHFAQFFKLESILMGVTHEIYNVIYRNQLFRIMLICDCLILKGMFHY